MFNCYGNGYLSGLLSVSRYDEDQEEDFTKAHDALSPTSALGTFSSPTANKDVGRHAETRYMKTFFCICIIAALLWCIKD